MSMTSWGSSFFSSPSEFFKHTFQILANSRDDISCSLRLNMDRNDSEDGEEFCEDLSFEEAFAPLAHHLFPDGVSQADLSDIWPHRTDRRPVSLKDARQSIQNLLRISTEEGLNSSEMWLVTVAACATLPSSRTVASTSALIDGTSFLSLLRCLIPKSGFKITSTIVMKLLGIQCDYPTRCIILRVLAGAFRNGWLDIQAEKMLSSLYGVVFSMIFDQNTCSDAIRLLYFITKRSHVRLDRIRRMKNYYDEHSNTEVGVRSPVAPILLLIHLYANFDPVLCSKYIPVTNKINLLGLYRKTIMREAFTVKKKRGRPKKRPKIDLLVSSEVREWLRDALQGEMSWSWRNEFNQSAWKASALLTNERLQCLASLENETPSSEIVRLRSSLPFLLHEEWYDSYRYTQKISIKEKEILEEEEDDDYSVSGSVSKFGAKKAPDLDSSLDDHIRLLESFASFAIHTGALLPEMESFLINEILPSWDGTDAVGRILCYDLLPFLSPMRFEQLESHVLTYLEQFVLYGGPRLQYLIVAGTLAALIRRWGRLDWSQLQTLKVVDMSGYNPTVFQQMTLGRLIQWTDLTVLKASLLQNDHLLLSMAALDFFKSVAKLTGNDCPFLISPSPALVYHFLVSPSSAIVVDGICQLLVDYKESFQKLKALDEFRQNAHPISGMEWYGTTAQELSSIWIFVTSHDPPCFRMHSVTVFNSFIWDFCNVLWKCILTWNEDGKDPVASLLLSHLPNPSRQALQQRGEGAAASLSIVQGSLFVGYVDRFCEELATSNGVEALDPSILLRQGNLKLNYFDFLHEECGFHGLYAFLTTFAGSLAQRREEQLQQAQETA